jgi:uncharacterized protein YwqG
MVWPSGPDGALRFVCQLDLAEVRARGGPEWLPSDGRLFAFHDDRFGFADQFKIVDCREPGPFTPRAIPTTSAWEYQERHIDFSPALSVPSLDWIGEDVADLDVSDEELDALVALSGSALEGPSHRIGGYPEELQDEQMALSCEYAARGLERDPVAPVPSGLARASRDWRLLLQIDSDPELGIGWGDGGRFYVFVRESDALAGEFSKTVTLSQTS